MNSSTHSIDGAGEWPSNDLYAGQAEPVLLESRLLTNYLNHGHNKKRSSIPLIFDEGNELLSQRIFL